MGGAVLFGQERANIEALAALKEMGCEVLCLIRNDGWSTQMAPALTARGLAWTKLPYIEHRLPGRLRYVLLRNPVAVLRANWRFLRIARKFHPTHVHAGNPLHVANFLIGLLVVRAALVYRAGDQPTVHNRIWRALWNFVVWRTDRFVANSRFVAGSLARHGVPPGRISVIYNRPPNREPASDAVPAGRRAGRIAFIGQIGEHKGVHVLIEAFRLLAEDYPEARLSIAGRISQWRGDAWARELKAATLADVQLSRRVEFLGETDGVHALLCASDIHAAPSLFEDPSPNVVMEAKQAGCPSVVFARGGLPELVADGIDGLVCPEATAPALAEALRLYLAEPALARRHGAAARQSLARLGVPGFAERWLNIYELASQSRCVPAAEPARRAPIA